MDLPMSSLSEDKGAGHGNTLGKEIKIAEVVETTRAQSEKTSPDKSSQELFTTALHGKLYFGYGTAECLTFNLMSAKPIESAQAWI